MCIIIKCVCVCVWLQEADGDDRLGLQGDLDGDCDGDAKGDTPDVPLSTSDTDNTPEYLNKALEGLPPRCSPSLLEFVMFTHPIRSSIGELGTVSYSHWEILVGKKSFNQPFWTYRWDVEGVDQSVEARSQDLKAQAEGGSNPSRGDCRKTMKGEREQQMEAVWINGGGRGGRSSTVNEWRCDGERPRCREERAASFIDMMQLLLPCIHPAASGSCAVGFPLFCYAPSSQTHSVLGQSLILVLQRQ